MLLRFKLLFYSPYTIYNTIIDLFIRNCFLIKFSCREQFYKYTHERHSVVQIKVVKEKAGCIFFFYFITYIDLQENKMKRFILTRESTSGSAM